MQFVVALSLHATVLPPHCCSMISSLDFCYLSFTIQSCSIKLCSLISSQPVAITIFVIGEQEHTERRSAKRDSEWIEVG
jgi:hypothetical protein